MRYDQYELDTFGVEELPADDYVLPIINGRWAGTWGGKYHFPGSGGTVTVSGATEAECWEKIGQHRQRSREFWLEKIQWKEWGDIAPQRTYKDRRPATPVAGDRRNVLRHDNRHYVVSTFGMNTGSKSCLGFGGHVFRWRWLDDPKIYESNNVFTQGNIPEEHRELLPDNVEWVDL